MTYGTQDGSTVEGYNLTGDGYNKSGVSVTAATSSYNNKASFSDNGMIPSEWNNGSNTTYYCDYAYLAVNDTYYALVGGDWASGLYDGAFYVYLCTTASISGGARGASISCKPLS
jgi:hypothetical protein